MTVRTGTKAFLAVALWGASFVATKVALAEISPLTVIVSRFGVGGVLIVAGVKLVNQRRV
jgi:drug/metabolite transporter (DMT)-like permease